MTTQTELHEALLVELADIERQQQDPTLSHLDQQLLDQAWEDTVRRLEELETIADSVVEEDWRDARSVIDEDEDRDTPPAVSPVRFAPSPPPITFGPGDPFYPPPVTRSLAFHGVPPLSATRQEVPIPPDWRPLGAPPPPLWEPDDDEISRWNALEDDREGCARCSGCHYCTGYGYDESDEV